ncbi:lipid-A-disaccharide synthase-related protein [Tumidithrix helvetica PCC 7403]|uniref:lipid-A-disaccharide synthase-related protein n=1 Tax=Tumidithrix helvetica TaxID=3457545 RepID=UPI003C94EF56
MTKRVLFLSNGHGEDLNASLVLKAFQQKYPEVEVAALPIVGEGNSYLRLDVPIIAPTRSLPSGGFVYMDNRKLLSDLRSGLLGLTWQQIQAARAYGRTCDLIFAAGDIVPLAIARLTGCPYAAFIVSSSSYYENRVSLPFLTMQLLRSRQCQVIFTRDAFSAQQLNQRGISKALFAGYPIMDVLEPTGKNLGLVPQLPTIALLPGSRLPESVRNFGLLLDLAIEISREFAPHSVQFQAALTPNMMLPQQGVESNRVEACSPLQTVALQKGWQYQENGRLYHAQQDAIVNCHCDAFATILQKSDLVIGMAGTAVEQAVGLGKPVIQIVGEGPQFTYRFAEAQMRLLGRSVQTIGKAPATSQDLIETAKQVKQTLGNAEYLQQCIQNGLERVGDPGGSAQIAEMFAHQLGIA